MQDQTDSKLQEITGQEMNVLEMTDSELYEMGINVLSEKLGASEVPRFIRQCQPGTGDYSVDRHKMLENQQDIDTIVKQIEKKRKAWEAEERARAKRFSAPQSEIRKMTDIEIYEIGSQVLVNKFGAAGSMQFIGLCQEINGGYPRSLIKSREDAEEFIKLYTAGLTLYPKMVEGYIKRGNAYSYIGEHDKAIADYSETIKLKTNYAKAYYKRGNVYRNKVDFDKAVADYTKAIELNPDYAEVYGTRGEAWLHLKQWERARADLTFARNRDFDIIASFRKQHKNVVDFEEKNNIQLPEDITAMLRQQ